MGFQPKNMPQPFVKNNQSQSTYRRTKVDRLVTVKGYNTNQGIMSVQDDDGRNLDVHIGKDAIERNKKAEETNPKSADAAKTAKWLGYMVDERMAKSIPEGSRVILENAFMANKIKKTIEGTATEVYVFEANRICNVTEPSPDKTFEGLFSIAIYEQRVFQVQSWNEKALDIGDVDSIEKLKTDIQEGYDAYIAQDSKPSVGVQFRVIQPKGEGYEVLDTSTPFDWISRQKDDAGNEVSPGSPLTPQRFDELCDGYAGYVSEAFPQDKYPDVLLEIITYKNYMASSMSRALMLSENQYSPLNQLANVSTKLAISDDYFVQGKNYAVKGVIQISGDKIEKTVKGMEVKPRNIVNRLHANGIKGNVQSFVRAADGKVCRPHEALKNVPINKATPGEKVEMGGPNDGGMTSATDSHASVGGSDGGVSNDGFSGDSASGNDGGWGADDDGDPFADVPTPATAPFGRK